MPDDVVFVVDPVGFQRAFHSWEGPLGRGVAKMVVKETALAAISAPGPGKPPRGRTGINYATGLLQASIGFQLRKWGNELEGQVHAYRSTALMVHEGTRAHPIFPRKPGGRMNFYWIKEGKHVSLVAVNHPGTPGIPFLSENLREAIR